MELSVYLKQGIESFYKKLCKPNDRYNSWEYCYIFFQKYKDISFANLNNEEKDLAALNLAFYLASWGMYRGSSFLLQYDYKVFITLIEKLLTDDKYKIFWNMDIENIDVASYVKALREAGTLIEKELKDKANNNINVTDTLITKILMGIFGCVPAYDRFFCDGVKELNNKYNIYLSSSFNDEGLNLLIEFVKRTAKKNLWKMNGQAYKLHNNADLDYPIMKLVDMCFWQIGYNNSFKAIKVKDKEIILMRNLRGNGENIYETSKIRANKYTDTQINKLKNNIDNSNDIRFSDADKYGGYQAIDKECLIKFVSDKCKSNPKLFIKGLDIDF